MICFGTLQSNINNNYVYTFPVTYIAYYSACVTCKGENTNTYYYKSGLSGIRPCVNGGDKPRDWISIGY